MNTSNCEIMLINSTSACTAAININFFKHTINITFAGNQESVLTYWPFSLSMTTTFHFETKIRSNMYIEYLCLTEDKCELTYTMNILSKLIQNFNFAQLFDNFSMVLYDNNRNRTSVCRTKSDNIEMCIRRCKLSRTRSNLEQICDENEFNNNSLKVYFGRALSNNNNRINTDSVTYQCNRNFCNGNDAMKYVDKVIDVEMQQFAIQLNEASLTNINSLIILCIIATRVLL
ncbi:unnamed protein product [Didymodactylos carnosus]|uniref:Uncharacterized protein n=1 Tax=Didymodactylos carnosus TaxID=1234261 RepID=A0A814SR86_9BILA|nr:unnamed protein product [Didymodactylos carnosus]CAF3914738.1 unnamed protein product [Didymodactylos carnosus]